MGVRYNTQATPIIKYGKVTIPNLAASVTTADANIKASDIIIATNEDITETKSLNAYCSAGSFTIGHANVEPGNHTAGYIILRG